MNDETIYLTENDLQPELMCFANTKKGICKRKCKTKDSKYCKLHEKFYKFEKSECPVCMESLENEIKPLSCYHWVHRKCVIKWGKSNCPVCRSEIVLTEKEKKLIEKDNVTDSYEITSQLREYIVSIVNSYSIRSFSEIVMGNIDVSVIFNDIDIWNVYEEDVIEFDSRDYD